MHDNLPFLRKLGDELAQLAVADEAAQRSSTRRHWRRPTVALAVPALAVILLAVVAIAPSNQSGGLAGAYAAMSPDGQILHTVQQITIKNDGRLALAQTSETFWDGSRLRGIIRDGDELVSETVVDDGSVITYLAKRNRLREAPLNLQGGARHMDPVQIFRELYRDGKLDDAGSQTVDGRQLTKVTMSEGRELRTWLIDPETENPVQYTIQAGDPQAPEYVFTARYTTYERLPLTEGNKIKLQMTDRPGADKLPGLARPDDLDG